MGDPSNRNSANTHGRIEETVASDADKEIMFIISFTSPVHIRKIMVVGGNDVDNTSESPTASHPSKLKCYVNQDRVDFSSITSLKSVQDFDLEVNTNGSKEYVTNIRPFTNVNTLILFFPDNHGDVDKTVIQYI